MHESVTEYDGDTKIVLEENCDKPVSWLTEMAIKSYLLNRSFYVNIENTKSSLFQLLYGVPQGSVLGPLLFILYTTPLNTVISNSYANHHL